MTPTTAVVRELGLAWALLAVVLAVADRLGALGGAVAGLVAILPALAFALIPLAVLRLSRSHPHARPLPDPLGIDRAPLGRGVVAGLVASVVVLPLFAMGLDVLETRVLHNQRHGVAAWQSAGVAFQGRNASAPGRVLILDDRRGLAVENRTKAPVWVQPACPTPVPCAPRTLAPGGRLLLAPAAAAQFAVTSPSGAPLPAGVLQAGASGEPLTSPLSLPPSLAWLWPFLLTQLLVIALPEEMFFRGYVLGRLRQLWPPQRRLLGVPFGAAHVVSSVLFALIHLVTVPSPARLLVFFPALLFAWLAERTRGTFAPAVHHALANTVQALLLLLYGAPGVG